MIYLRTESLTGVPSCLDTDVVKSTAKNSHHMGALFVCGLILDRPQYVSQTDLRHEETVLSLSPEC